MLTLTLLDDIVYQNINTRVMGRCKNRNRYLENIDFIKLISYDKDHLFSMKYISKCSMIIYERKC